MYLQYEQAYDTTYNKTCVTSKDSAQHVHPPSMAMVLVYLSLDSLDAVEGTCDQRTVCSDCAHAQAIGPDKGGYPVNIFLISARKHMLWVLIRSASVRRF